MTTSILCIKGGDFMNVGSKVIANENSPYAGLLGVVVDVRDNSNKETDNEGKDIYVSFNVPSNKKEIKILEERFSELYRQPMTIEDISLDLVIMSDDELIFIGE